MIPDEPQVKHAALREHEDENSGTPEIASLLVVGPLLSLIVCLSLGRGGNDPPPPTLFLIQLDKRYSRFPNVHPTESPVNGCSLM